MSRGNNGTVVVCLNYRTPDQTIAAIRSLQISQASPGEIIVVDNASGDGSPARIASDMPGVRILVTAANGGFSAGCNFGIREALRLGAEQVLLLNSDVIVPPGMLKRLEDQLNAEPDLGIVAPIVVSSAPAALIESIGIRYSRATGRMYHDAFGQALSAMAPFDCRRVDGVSGCAMLVRRQVFETVGLLAEEYFFGFEDLDFCLRAQEAGFGCACLGTTTIQHVGNLSIGRTSVRRIYFATRNHLLLASRTGASDGRLTRWLRIASILGLNLAYVMFRAQTSRVGGLHAYMNGARDYFVGRYGGAPAQML